MKKYRIAELNVLMNPKYDTLQKHGEAYLCDFDSKEDIIATVTDQELDDKNEKWPNLTLDECEYIWTGASFYEQLLDFKGMVLHASAVALDGNAYLFSAPCGGGKSTHTSLWQRRFGNDRAIIINDDKPALRTIDDKFYVFGTPFSGKYNLSANIKVPLKAICFIEHAPTNSIRKMSAVEALMQIFNQTLRPVDPKKMEQLIAIVDKLLKDIPVYKLGCTVSLDAVDTAFNAMSK